MNLIPIPQMFQIPGKRVKFVRLYGNTIAERKYLGSEGTIAYIEMPYLLYVEFSDGETHPFNWQCFDPEERCPHCGR